NSGHTGYLEGGPRGGILMRGRKPRSLSIAAADRPILEFVARDRRLAWFQVQHARIILAIAAGERVGDLTDRLECDRTTVWRVCRRYEQGGLKQLLQDGSRQGHPPEISPPPAGPDRRTRLPGTDRQGVARHPLVQRGSGSSGGRGLHRVSDQRGHGLSHLAAGRLATASHSLLADREVGRAFQGAGREG